jgi:hypothetical protein
LDLGEQARQVKFMIRDRGSDFTAAFDAILTDTGTRTALCNVRTPRMNAIAERWIGGTGHPDDDRRLQPVDRVGADTQQARALSIDSGGGTGLLEGIQ